MVTTARAALWDWLLPPRQKSPIDIDVAPKQPASTPAAQVSAREATPPQSAPLIQKPAPAAAPTSPGLVGQREAISRDLTVVRHQEEPARLRARTDEARYRVTTGAAGY